jgi:hypothetical protein
MGREVRRVPSDWEHPSDERGYKPLYDHFPFGEDEVAEGLRDGWLKGEPPHYGVECMPDWPESLRTHYQMYETTSEGTPISPVMESPEALARWLVEAKASANGNDTASYEGWLRVCQGGYAPTLIVRDGQAVNGVDGFED